MKNNAATLRLTNNYHKDQHGMSFIWLIGVLLGMSVIGTGIAYIATGSTYNAAYKTYHTKALYVAEAGGNYAVPRLASDIDTGVTTNIYALDNQTFPLGNASFLLSIDNTQKAYMYLKSTSTVNKNSIFTAQRLVTFRLNKPVSDNFDNKNNWNGTDATVVSDPTGQMPSGSKVLQLGTIGGSQTQSQATMNWNNNPLSSVPDLLSQWYIGGQLLSYELQCKVYIDSETAQDHMAGLSFRLGEDNHKAGDNTYDTTYGVSFYRKNCTTGCPGWITAADFTALTNDYVYIVLWKEIQGTYYLLAYKRLTTADGLVSSNSSGATLNPWSTILVTVLEKFNGANRENHIYVYTGSSTSIVIPALTMYTGGTINWTHYFKGVVWDTINPSYVTSSGTWSSYAYNFTALASQPYIIDSSTYTPPAITTENFAAILPPEIGLHSYYNTSATTYQYFADYAMRFPGGSSQNVIAYY
ncbi:MAG: hypothetical protein H7843_01675 [Nitrospirota bacterium]